MIFFTQSTRQFNAGNNQIVIKIYLQGKLILTLTGLEKHRQENKSGHSDTFYEL